MAYYAISDDTTTLTFNGTTADKGEVLDEGWAPTTPDVSETEVRRIFFDGGESTADYLNVVESLPIELYEGGSGLGILNALDTIKSLNILFDQARDYQRTKVGTPVYFKFRWGDLGEIWRSEILWGRVVLPGDTLSAPWASAVIRPTLVFKRRFFWERSSRISIYDSEAQDITNDANNYIDYNEAFMEDLPAPLDYWVVNNTAGSTIRNVYVGQGVKTWRTIAHVLEGESSTAASATKTNTASAAASGGSFGRLQWAVQTATDLVYWTLNSTLLNATRGMYFRPLMRLSNATGYTNLWLRLKLTLGTDVLWRSPEIILPATGQLHEMPMVQLPPALFNLTATEALRLYLTGRRATAGTHTLDVDYVQLFPLTGYRKLSPVGYTAGESEVVADTQGQISYVLASDVQTIKARYNGLGAPIMLQPGANRLFFLWDDATGSAAATKAARVFAWVRPRRLNLTRF